MTLTDTAIRQAKPKEKAYSLKDENGLYLQITPKGSKLWRLRYWIQNKENRISLGKYPEVSLRDARDRRDEYRKLIADGQDPSTVRKADKEQERLDSITFEILAREWHEKFSPSWTENTIEANISRLSNNVFPFLGSKSVNSITAPMLLTVVRRIEERGAKEVAKRVLQLCGQVFRYGVATGQCERDPSGDLKGALAPHTPKPQAAITDKREVAKLLRSFDEFKGSFVVLCALKFSAYTFCRPGEIRKAEWAEFNLEEAIWDIPAPKMKMKKPHRVPLSRQVVELLQNLHLFTGTGQYVFPSNRTQARPMSENTVTAAIRRLGYGQDEMCAHGFRSMASSLLHESGWNSDIIERQLAHLERNSVKAAYDRSMHLEERTKMMQWWADYLDALKAGAKVTPIGTNLKSQNGE